MRFDPLGVLVRVYACHCCPERAEEEEVEDNDGVVDGVLEGIAGGDRDCKHLFQLCHNSVAIFYVAQG